MGFSWYHFLMLWAHPSAFIIFNVAMLFLHQKYIIECKIVHRDLLFFFFFEICSLKINYPLKMCLSFCRWAFKSLENRYVITIKSYCLQFVTNDNKFIWQAYSQSFKFLDFFFNADYVKTSKNWSQFLFPGRLRGKSIPNVCKFVTLLLSKDVSVWKRHV